MPIVRIDYDDKQVTDEQIKELCAALKKIVADTTKIKEVYVYANSPQIKLGIDPVEVFVQITKEKVGDKGKLFEELKNQISNWRKISNFDPSINFTLMPMDWQFEVDI